MASDNISSEPATTARHAAEHLLPDDYLDDPSLHEYVILIRTRTPTTLSYLTEVRNDVVVDHFHGRRRALFIEKSVEVTRPCLASSSTLEILFHYCVEVR